jgi:hypothetical protein
MKERLFVLGFCIAITIGCLGGCTDKKSKQLGTGENMSGKTIEQVLGENTGRWLKIDLVVGVAIGMLEDKPCIRILVGSDPDQVRKQIPENVEGYAVVIEETGTLKARD